MNINGTGLYSEMQTMVKEAQGPNTQPTRAVAGNDSGDRFADLFQSAVNNVNALQKQASTMRTQLEMGDRSVSLGDTMIAAQKSSIAFQATLQVRNKLVEAYKDIMSMPV